MIIKNILDEDFTNYKTCSMFIGFPTCTFKCEKECNCIGMCQNTNLAHSPNIEISAENIVTRYLSNPISSSIVIGGLEPFDSFEQLACLIHEFRKYTNDTIVIYTGWYEAEISQDVEYLRQNYNNIIIKFGRFIPNQEPHYDELLGITLASNNQYAEKIS